MLLNFNRPGRSRAVALAAPAPRGSGLLWGLGAVLLWSQSAPCLKVILATTPWLPVAFWTSVLSALVYGIAAAATGRLARLRALSLREVATLAGIGAAGYFLYNACLYTAYARGPASEVLIINYLWPVATVGFAALLSRERPSLRELGGLALAVAGVVGIVTRGRLHWPRVWDADLLALGAALSYGLYSAASKRVGGDWIVALLIAFTFSAALFAATMAFARTSFWIPQPVARWLVVYHGIVVSGIPALFWLKTLEAQRAARAAILVYLTPVLGLIWLRLLLPDERITAWVLLGFALIAAGFLLQLSARPRTLNPES